MADDPETYDAIRGKRQSVHRTPPSRQSDLENSIADFSMGVDATPSMKAARKFGSIDDDIDLPKETTKPTTKPVTTKPITKGRSLAGGKR